MKQMLALSLCAALLAGCTEPEPEPAPEPEPEIIPLSIKLPA